MIYLDNAATTQISEEVLDAMMPYLTNNFANPGAIYSAGLEAARAVSKAREQVASLFNCDPSCIVFTSGGSEGNSLVLYGLRPYMNMLHQKKIISSTIEHDSVLNALTKLSHYDGFNIDLLNVDYDGVVCYDDLNLLLPDDDVGLVSVMYVNNETGAINPIDKIGEICRKNRILFHTDCVQAAGIVDLDMSKLPCDYATISSHKIHGPKGVGAVFRRDRRKLVPIIHGGNVQEFGIRGGTENVAGIVGFGKACEVLKRDMFEDLNELKSKYDYFVAYLHKAFQDNQINIPGFRVNSVNNGKIMSITLPGVDAQALILALSSADVAVSAGSACTSHLNKPSHVLKAMGFSDEDANSTIRISFSKYLTFEDLEIASNKIALCIKALKSLI